MGRRHFDDYEPDDWKEEHKRAERERRKRDAKRHRHDSEEKSESRDGRDSRPYCNAILPLRHSPHGLKTGLHG